MCDEWMPTIKLTLSEGQFRQLPRSAAYRYDYYEGQALLTPRPRHYHGRLDLIGETGESARAVGLKVGLRPLRASDWPELESLFVESFRAIQPFGSLDDAVLREASQQCLQRTRTGGDGPLISSACWVAVEGEMIVGTALATLVPEGDPCDSESYRWREPPPEDCIAARRGRPHLTWIFVAPYFAGKGIGTALLDSLTRELRALGFTYLLTTFVLGNDSSMLWHWRNGFELLTFPGSHRRPPRRPP